MLSSSSVYPDNVTSTGLSEGRRHENSPVLVSNPKQRNKRGKEKGSCQRKKRQSWLIKKAGGEEVKVQPWSSKENADKARISCCCWNKRRLFFYQNQTHAGHMEGYPTLSTNVLPVRLALVRKTLDFSATDRKAKWEKARSICPLTQLATALEYGGETPRGNIAERPSPHRRMAS